jgi:transitional endoplasmic reticulum ATPase
MSGSITAAKLTINSISNLLVGETTTSPRVFKTRDFYAKFIALKMLEHWEPDHNSDSLLTELWDRDTFEHSALPADLTLICKWKAELETQQREEKWVYIMPRKILDKADVTEYVKAVRNHHDLPTVLPDHVNLAFLCDLLDVEGIERDALNHALHRPRSYDISGNHYVWLKILAMDEMKTSARAYQAILGFDESDQYKKLLNGSLRKTGILTPLTPDLFSLNNDLSNIFLKENISKEYIEETLFPSSMKTELSVKDYPHVAKETKRVVQIVNRNLKLKVKGTNIMLWGSPGTGKTELTLAMAKEGGWNLRVIGDMSSDDTTEKSRAMRLTSLKLAMKLLANDPTAVLLFDEMEDLFKSDNDAAFSKAFINRIIESSPVPIIWTVNSLLSVEYSVLRRMVYNINLESPPAETREIIWKRYCREIGLRLSPPAIKKLAANYEIAPALIRNAVQVSYAVVGDRRGKRSEEEVSEVVANLDRLVRLGETRAIPENDDSSNPYDVSCVNSDVSIEQLTADIMSANPNWSLCLYGAPGTGKSQYGRYLAELMGKKLMLKRASDLISMWVGGTEKNIAAAFAEAAKNKQVLLIDEGDSFLRNRELARNSWEITSVNEMLSQMERHTHPFILTTNLMADLDPAAMRRFTFKLKFDFLTTEQARRLFKQYFGVEAPAEIDRNHLLAPGDFANVKRQVQIRKITDAQRIYDLIKAETALKPQSTNSMGF